MKKEFYCTVCGTEKSYELPAICYECRRTYSDKLNEEEYVYTDTLDDYDYDEE